jgi:hypothetical protein
VSQSKSSHCNHNLGCMIGSTRHPKCNIKSSECDIKKSVIKQVGKQIQASEYKRV